MVRLSLRRGGRAQRLDAPAIARHLAALAAERGLGDRVRIREGCAGGCQGPGPNVDVTRYPLPHAGERQDHVAVGWKTYVYSISTLDCLATIIDENLTDD